MAAEFVEKTNVSCLAVLIGNAHGHYKKTPKLDIDRVKAIREATGGIPLVLHGGSGLSDDDFRNTIANGIRKVNICTEMCIAARESYQRSANHEILFNDAKEAVKNVVKTKMKLFGSSGKA